MKTEPHESATGYSIPGDEKNGWLPESIPGLTKREDFAKAAMIGLIASCDWKIHVLDQSLIETTAEKSVLLANALIEALNK